MVCTQEHKEWIIHILFMLMNSIRHIAMSNVAVLGDRCLWGNRDIAIFCTEKHVLCIWGKSHIVFDVFTQAGISRCGIAHTGQFMGMLTVNVFSLSGTPAKIYLMQVILFYMLSLYYTQAAPRTFLYYMQCFWLKAVMFSTEKDCLSVWSQTIKLLLNLTYPH